MVQINPKNVTYEAFGDLGAGGKVVYANLDSQPVEVRLASLPWSHSATTMSPSATLSLVMQVDGDSAGCRIRVDGQVRDEHVVNHQSAVAGPVVLVAAENSQSPKTRCSYGGRCTSALATPAVIQAENSWIARSS